jgi:GT2 family glycosyltransferase
MTASVASLTVAYNASWRLQHQIEALLRQTCPLQEIVIIDNASTDGTAELLSDPDPQITLLRMKTNIGVGGALAAGLSYALLEKGYDWVWTFDHDSVPDDSALQILLSGAESLRNPQELGMIAALPFHCGTGNCYHPLLWKDGFFEPSAEQMRQPIWYADLVISSGCLVRREVVEKIGLPRSDFFIDFVDFEYCLRARSAGYKIAVVPGARFSHEIGSPRKIELPGSFRLWPIHAPFREYYLSRNLAYTAWWLYPNQRTKSFVIRFLARHAAGVLLFSSNKLACLTKILQGFSDGREGRLGARFLPDSEP